MDLQLLGPVEATLDGRPIPLGATKQRAVLAMLALQANATVSVDRLVDGLWADDPPPTASKMVQAYVSQLRRLLAGTDAEIVTHGRGYELRVGDDAVDAVRFERLVERAASGEGRPNGAAREALALWHGSALADVAHEPFAAAEIRRLDELRLRAAELAIEDDLAAGREQEALAQLELLIDQHPLRERLRAQRMLALYRSGRQSEALDAYVEARRRLVDEVGVEPGAELRELHERILSQDPALARRPATVAPGGETDRGRAAFVTILFTDLVGSTSLFDRRGDDDADAVRRAHFTALRRAIAEHGGREVKSTGDGLMVAFASAVAAVRCAVAMQRATEASEDGLGLRVGLDAGEPLAEGDDLYGRAVIIASRLCNAARGGEILATEVVRQVAGPRVAALMRPLGPRAVRGIADQVSVAEVRWREARPQPAVGPVAASAPAARERPVRRLLSRNLLAGGLVLAAALVTLGVALLGGKDDELQYLAENAVGVIDAGERRITEQYRLRTRGPLGSPGAVAAGAGAVWVADPSAGTVSRIHAHDNRVDTIDVVRSPVALAFGGGSLWVAGAEDGAVIQVDPGVNRAVQRIAVGNGLRALAVGHGAVWAATAQDGEVVRIDLRSGRITNRTSVGGQPVDLAIGRDAVWVAAEESGQLVRLDARSAEVLTAIDVGPGVRAVAVGLGAVWTANRDNGTVSRIDPATERVTETLPVGREPVALALARGGVWVADAAGAVVRLDARTRATVATVRTEGSPAGLAAVDGAVWVTAGAAEAGHRGGTLRVGRAPETLFDPAVGGYDPGAAPLLALAYDTLVAYARAGGAAGARLTGSLALAVPAASDGGRRYVFRLRPGLRYADGVPVRARDVRASIERALALSDSDLLDAIEGAARCRRSPTACDLSAAIAADDRTRIVSIRLRRPDPELLQKLAVPLFAIVPSTTPRRALSDRPPAGTGPYRFAGVVPRRRALLKRNPYFRPHRGPGARTEGFADRVEVKLGKERDLAAAAEAGRLDLMELWSASAGRLRALRTRVGTRLRSGALIQTFFIELTVRIRPFDDVRVRRAVNLAVDRARIIELTGGSDTGSPTCQLLPPGIPGYRPICTFTAAPSPAGAWTAPDVTEAKRLVADSGTRGAPVSVLTDLTGLSVARYVAGVLRELGFRARVRAFADFDALVAAIEHPDGRAQATLGGWIADFPEPAAYVRALVSCHGIANEGGFCDRSIDHAIDRAQAAGAGGDWEAVERRIAERAPVVPLGNRRLVTLASARAGNLNFHLMNGVLLDQVWVR